MAVLIQTDRLTKRYGASRGIIDVTFFVGWSEQA
jgi:hypothetical protein